MSDLEGCAAEGWGLDPGVPSRWGAAPCGLTVWRGAVAVVGGGGGA